MIMMAINAYGRVQFPRSANGRELPPVKVKRNSLFRNPHHAHVDRWGGTGLRNASFTNLNSKAGP